MKINELKIIIGISGINYSKDTIMRMDFNILTNKLEQEETITLGVEAREENFSFSDIPFLQEVCNRYKENKSLYLDGIDEFKALTESLKNILIKDFI